MKRFLLVIGLYSLVWFLTCIVVSAFVNDLPILLPSAVAGYRFKRGLLWFLDTLPVILLSAFVLGGCIQWKGVNYNSMERFSEAMVGRFKLVMLSGIAIVFIATLCNEVFIPSLEQSQKIARQNPSLLKKDVALANRYLKEQNEILAYQYAELAYKIDSKNEDALLIYSKTHELMETTLKEIKAEERVVEKIETPMASKDREYTVKELIEKSKAAFENEEWFNAHYWAVLAQEGSSATELNHGIAQDLASVAWNKMSETGGFNNDAERNYYMRKREGYAALNYGDYLRSYYIFEGLYDTGHEDDPDVIRYLELAREQVENEYFFIDETENMPNMNVTNDLYFTLKLQDGSVNVIYIGQMASIKQDGGFVRYFSDFNLVSYSRFGTLSYSLYVPFAKAMAVPVSILDEGSKIAMGVYDEWKNIPLLYLTSVDRKTEGIVSRPRISYKERGLPEYLENELNYSKVYGQEDDGELEYEEDLRNIMFLPMAFDDFDLLSSVAEGPETMNLLKLNGFIPKCSNYGFSEEVFLQSLVRRGTFPLVLLIMVVFAGSFAWNYRVHEEDAVFKFVWLFFLPVMFVAFYVVYNIAMYFCRMLDYMFVGWFGSVALLVTFGFYVIALFIVSLMFLARRS